MKRTDGRGVGRAFAQGVSAQNSNGQLFSPDGKVVFSYGAHWPIAAWIDGQLHVNDGKYSPTTSKHRSFIASAIPSNVWASRVSHPGPRELYAAMGRAS